ncbi:MAG: DivIVA domain-containing protein [Bacteroidia bacterium]|nr:DivIVA domain-containing protein [Bacteroidia bacterium]MDW8236292.1 DivIVA domain-containing protein [Bacteroidia bacterium]
MLTPIDIQNQTFNRTLRGYDPEEVRNFLRQVAHAMSELLEERHTLRQKNEQLQRELNHYKEMEALLQRTLLQAEEASRQTIQNAEKNATLILQEARQKAEEMLASARRQREQIEEAIEILQQRRQGILLELKTFLTLQLERLEQLNHHAPNTASAPPPTTEKPSSWASRIADKL